MTNMTNMMDGIRPNGTVEGRAVETHYMPCRGIIMADGYIRVIIDAPGYDIETRFSTDLLTPPNQPAATPTVDLALILEQAQQGLGVEHDCPAMYACACIVAEFGPGPAETVSEVPNGNG